MLLRRVGIYLPVKMQYYNAHMKKVKILFIVAFVLLFAAACTEEGAFSSRALAERARRNINAEQNVTNEAPANFGPLWPALALLQTGENPLWFELGPQGPILIESPAAASLVPYHPWPHARHITGILPWNGFLVMAVNRDGFFALGPASGFSPAGLDSHDYTSVILYHAAGSSWDPYTAGSFFIWDNLAAVLLYQNYFFTGFADPSLRSQFYVLEKSNPDPLRAFLPVLENFPPNWDAEIVHQGPDGYWYFRMKERGEMYGEIAHFRASDLTEEGERIAVGEWRNSLNPENPVNAPAHLAAILERVLDTQEVAAVRAVSPDFLRRRFFSSASAAAFAGDNNGEDLTVLLGYYRANPQPLALAIRNDGQGYYSLGREALVRPFSLPPLPDAFVYTGIALLGNVLVAAWEEQQEAGIGAAGFFVMSTAPWRYFE